MPKQKTHSGTKKRFRLTGQGKLMKQQSGMRHNLELKAASRKARLNKDQLLAPADVRSVKRMLGI